MLGGNNMLARGYCGDEDTNTHTHYYCGRIHSTKIWGEIFLK